MTCIASRCHEQYYYEIVLASRDGQLASLWRAAVGQPVCWGQHCHVHLCLAAGLVLLRHIEASCLWVGHTRRHFVLPWAAHV